MRLSLWASHSITAGWSVVFLSSTVSSPASPPLLSAICPHRISTGCSRSANKPLLLKLPKSRITAHLHSFISLFLPTFGINSLTLFNPILPFRSSKQLFTTTYRPPSKSSIFSTPINPPSKFPAFLPESPCNVHLVYPVFTAPSLFLLQIS